MTDAGFDDTLPISQTNNPGFVPEHHDEPPTKEPATAHDVGEGGALGAVGGAIVGGLAGGPLGAAIGAVAGGIASAGAVDVVDKHDGDYAETVAKAEPGSVDANAPRLGDMTETVRRGDTLTDEIV